jgi:hypothetical protein
MTGEVGEGDEQATSEGSLAYVERLQAHRGAQIVDKQHNRGEAAPASGWRAQR